MTPSSLHINVFRAFAGEEVEALAGFSRADGRAEFAPLGRMLCSALPALENHMLPQAPQGRGVRPFKTTSLAVKGLVASTGHSMHALFLPFLGPSWQWQRERYGESQSLRVIAAVGRLSAKFCGYDTEYCGLSFNNTDPSIRCGNQYLIPNGHNGTSSLKALNFCGFQQTTTHEFPTFGRELRKYRGPFVKPRITFEATGGHALAFLVLKVSHSFQYTTQRFGDEFIKLHLTLPFWLIGGAV